MEGRLSYEQAMSGQFQRLQRFIRGRAPLIWSLDDAHADYVDRAILHQAR
jgi:hypothetical protein